METKIDYDKAVDTIDEGILALNLLKAQIPFPELLKNRILLILKFLSLASKSDFKELLYDNRISINEQNLTVIHKKINDIKFSEKNIENAILLLDKAANNSLNIDEINTLQEYLLELSNPIWVAITSKKQYGE